MQRRRGLGDRRGLARPADVRQLGRQVVGEALQGVDRLADPQHQDQRGVGGQLHVHVGAPAQCVGHLEPGAAGGPHVDDDPQRVARGHAGLAHQLVGHQAAAVDGRDRLAGPGGGGQRAAQQVLAMDRQLAPGGVQRGVEQRRGAGRGDQAHRPPQSLGVDPAPGRHVQHGGLGERAHDLVGGGEDGVRAQGQGRRRHAGMEAEVRSPGLVDHEGGPVAVGDLRQRLHIGHHSVVGGRDRERRPRAAGRRQRLLQRLRRQAVRQPQVVVVGGRDPHGHPAREHQSVHDAAVRVALHRHPGAGRGHRQAQRVVALRGPVGEEPGAPGAVQGRRELLGHRERRGVGGRDVDAPRVAGDVQQQRRIAQRVAQLRVGAGAALVTGDVEARGLAVAVGGDRVQVGRGLLLQVAALRGQLASWSR